VEEVLDRLSKDIFLVSDSINWTSLDVGFPKSKSGLLFNIGYFGK